MRRALLALALLALFPATSEARDCRSGKTVYDQDGVRLFEDGRGMEYEWFACGPGSPRPTSLYVNSGAHGELKVFSRTGDQLLLAGTFASEGGSEETVVGFYDARTARTRVGDLAARGAVQDIVVAADDGIGVAAGDRVGYIAPGQSRELTLSRAPGYVPGSLAFSGGALTWTGEQRRSVPLGGEPAVTCTGGTTLVEHEGARVFAVLPAARRTDEGFQAEVLAACPRGASVPRELAVTRAEFGWGLRGVRSAGARVAFLAGGNGLGVLEGGDVRFLASPFVFVADFAIGASGPLVFAGERRIVREHSLFGWEWVAATGGDVAKDSLAISGEQVTWRTGKGAGSALLRPARPPDCSSGKTRLERRGLRVFEFVRVGGDKALLACLPGARLPLALLTPVGKPRWTLVSELAREHGRFALLVRAKGAEAHDVISVDPRGTFTGLFYGLRGTIRDVELAADGRVAIATQRGRRWRISALPLAGPGELGLDRTVAEPRDGVRRGTLGFDGDRVVWRNRAGALRRAEIR